MIISDYGKKCVVIDLDETLVHSSFKVGVAFKALNRKSHDELEVPALSFVSTMFIPCRYIYSELSRCAMNGMMRKKWEDVLEDVLNCCVPGAAEGGRKHYVHFLFKCLIVSSELELALGLKQKP